MDAMQSTDDDAAVHVENVGGITETAVEFTPGVTVLVGRNATNRTSFLQAVMAALGSENVAMKGDAEEASVELTLGDDSYSRQLYRRQGTVVTEGDPYLSDPELADLFAFLLESNEARRAVATGGDLRELIMRPIDTAEIKADIESLVEERQSLESRLEEIERLKGDLPGLEEKRTQLQSEIDEKRAELEAKEAELEAADADVEETRAEKSELEEELERLRGKRSQLDDVRYDLETERESLSALKEEYREVEDELSSLPDAPVGEIGELDEEMRGLRERKQRLEAEVNELQSVIGFNEEMMEDPDSSALAGLAQEDDGAVTDKLVDDDVRCWTCGSEVPKEQIGSTISRLRELSREKVSTLNGIESELEELRSEKRELEQAQRERDRLEQRRSELDGEIDRANENIERLQERREELTAEIADVEAAVESLEEADYSAVLDLHKEANQLEYELGRLETDLDRVESEIADIEDRIAEQDETEARLDTVKEDIEELRTKIERIEQGAVDKFNEHMDTVLSMLEYANLERIWLERVEREVREGRRKVTKSVFELHVIRTSQSGAAYEDTVDHLSESEREVTGLVFALAGYLVHEVYETVPFMLLDSLEAIDADRIAALVDYLTEYTEYLLVALLPEDAAALDDDYQRITEI
ncbi:archaea-specific SMC-related protein [Natronomonas sp. EA1]|uniref:archaea-specific SMC-related protein n=1 Tax=Natronomonas sp. EA1 TaxID=3421655 RepID=UPI003EB768EC